MSRQVVSVLSCVRCGSALELPADPRLVHIDCPGCGTDNVLPQALIEARRGQHELELQEQAAARAHREREAAQRSRTRLLVIGALGAVLLLGALAAVVVWVVVRDRALQRVAADPKQNGQESMLALLAGMTSERKCDRILIQPRVHWRESGLASLDMVDGAACVHIVAISGDGSPLRMTYDTGSVALRRPLPPDGARLDYRLCASQTATHSFTITAVDEVPFSLAAIECPRTVEEGAPRSREDDPTTSGVAAVKRRLDALFKAGCDYVVAQPAAQKGARTMTFTSKANSPCLNALASSAFPDVRLTVTLTDPNGNMLPTPEPASEIRVLYCPSVEGKYKLDITPSTHDHFGYASIDCPRNGPEGLRRAKALRKPR